MSLISSIFNKEKATANTVHDPEFEGRVEPAFKFLSTQYYRFKKDIDVPYGRYKWISSYLHEHELRMDLTTLKAYIESIKKSLSGEKGKVNISDAITTITKMESRMELAFDVKTAFKLASVVYFDDTEDLTSFDREKARGKIAAWEKDAKQLDFFLTRPMGELLGLSNISAESLLDYIRTQGEIIEALTLEMPELSPESTSNIKSDN